MLKNNQLPDLATYLTLNKWLKFKKLKHKLFSLAFIATHIPLIAYVAYLFISKQHNWSVLELLILVVATLSGTVFAMWAIHHLLKPLNYCTVVLDTYLDNATVTPIPHQIDDEMGQLMRSVGYTLDSMDRRFKELENVSSYDFLTDLHNRRSAKAKLNTDLKPTGNASLKTFIVMIDLDSFKSINDLHGHFAGDVILKDIAQEIKACFVSPDDWAARWGGDEFMLVLHGQLETVTNQLQILRKTVTNKQIPFEDHSLRYSISMGMTTYSAGKSILETIKTADNALFTAKKKGKNQLHQS